MNVELFIESTDKNTIYQPAVLDGISWDTERSGSPGKLTFKVLYDSTLNISEGCAVRLQVDGTKLFFGYIFGISGNKDEQLSITAYDQLRYLKAKDTKTFENLTATQIIQALASDFSLQCGTLADTKYVIASRTEENKSLFEMISNVLDMTLTNTGELYILYDDFGKITLNSLEDMRVGTEGSYLMLDEETGQNFDYTSSIDENTYNQIKLTYDNDETGKRDVYIAKDSTNINNWGLLQYYDTLQKGENGQAKADALLKLYNKKTKKLKLSKQFGDNRVRGGSLVIVNLDLFGTSIKNFMLVEKCTHTWNNGEHWMDLTLRGGEFST